MPLRIVFMGTPDFAVASLSKLVAEKLNVVAVVTVPDKPAGRGQKIQFSPVKQFAIENNIKVLQPEKLKDGNFNEELKGLQADLFIVVAFRMLPEAVWGMPRLGTFNLHASLLPQYRGAAPINWAIINGETETGVTTFFIEKDIDTGKILFSKKVEITSNDNAGTLHDKLMEVGSELIIKTVNAIENNTIIPVSQPANINGLNSAPKIFKDNCKIDWLQKGTEIYNFIRGLSPYPGAWTVIESKNISSSLKIFDAEFIASTHKMPVKTIQTDGKKYFNIAIKDGYINLKSLQMEGKKRLGIEEFLRGIQNIQEYKLI